MALCHLFHIDLPFVMMALVAAGTLNYTANRGHNSAFRLLLKAHVTKDTQINSINCTKMYRTSCEI